MTNLKSYEDLKFWFMNTLNEYYLKLYSSYLINTDRVGDERSSLIDKLIANLLGSYPDLVREKVLEDYIIWVLNFHKRNFTHKPVLKFITSDSRVTAFVRAYNDTSLDSMLTKCDQFIKDNVKYLEPCRTCSVGSFYGYPWERIRTFSKESIKYRLVWKLAKHEDKLPVNTSVILLFDEVLFYMLGSNYLEERKQQGKSTPELFRISSYEDIAFIMKIRYNLKTKLNQGLLPALGYIKDSIEIGTTTATLADLLLWKENMENNNKEVVGCVNRLTGITNELELMNCIKNGLKLLQNQVDKELDVWGLLKEGLIGKELKQAQERLKN